MIPLLLVLSLLHPPADSMLSQQKYDGWTDCQWIYAIIIDGGLGWYWQLDDPVEHTQFFEVCDEVVWAFTEQRAQALASWYSGDRQLGGAADQLHAMAVVQCESGLDNMANTRRWGGGTDGIWAFMEHLNWPRRLGFPDIDVFDNRQASFLASVMVYGGVNQKVSPPNFWWWWSCARSYQVVRRLGVYVPESSYCPPRAYWQNVRPTSGVAARASCGA